MSYIQIVDIGHEGYAISAAGVTLSGELDQWQGHSWGPEIGRVAGWWPAAREVVTTHS
jgi:hypothetical protein